MTISLGPLRFLLQLTALGIILVLSIFLLVVTLDAEGPIILPAMLWLLRSLDHQGKES
jgi:hypothetical protein